MHGLTAVAATAFIAGCASGPKSGGSAGGRGGGFYQQDGPGDPGRLQGADLADAVPRIEPLASGPNKPYTVLGRSYTPDTRERPFRQSGVGSWYGKQFHGRQTSSGERYDMYAMTAAHPTLPIPSYARVTSTANGRSVIVRVNDRGPFLHGRVIDLSYAAAHKLGYVGQGSAAVTVERILPDEIRAGTWQRGGATALAQALPEPAPAPAQAPALAPAPAPAGSAADPIAAFAATTAGEVPQPAPEPGASTAVPASGTVLVAQELGPLSPAGAPVPVPDPAPLPGDAGDPLPRVSMPGVYMQLGAFRAADGAESLARHLGSRFDWLASRLALDDAGGWYRLQAGPYATRGEAHAAATQVRDALGMSPVIVERR